MKKNSKNTYYPQPQATPQAHSLRSFAIKVVGSIQSVVNHITIKNRKELSEKSKRRLKAAFYQMYPHK